MLNRKQTFIAIFTLLAGWLAGWTAHKYFANEIHSESYPEISSNINPSPVTEQTTGLNNAIDSESDQQDAIYVTNSKPASPSSAKSFLSTVEIELKVSEIITMAYAYDVDQRLFTRANGYRKLLKQNPNLATRLLEDYFLLSEDKSSDLVKNLLGLYSMSNHHALDNQLLEAVVQDTNRLRALHFASEFDGFIDHDYSAKVRDLLSTFYNNEQIAAGLRASSARNPLRDTKPGDFIQESAKVYAAYFDAPSLKVKAAALSTLTHFPQENEQQLLTEAMQETNPMIVDEVLQLISNRHINHDQSKPYLRTLANNSKLSLALRYQAISSLMRLFELSDDEHASLDELSKKLTEQKP